MPVHDDLGDRMKTYYEGIPKTKLMRRCPVILRLDGKAFHSYSRGFKKPFDDVLINTMQETMRYLCENIQGCVFGYSQSDEITLVLVDYKKLTSQAWFDYEVQKMCSIAASMCTMAFNKCFEKNVWALRVQCFDEELEIIENRKQEYIQYTNSYIKAMNKGAMFDCRAFNIPKEEVTNCIYWRQLDAMRNSVQMVGQANFSHGELQHKSREQIKSMLVEQKGIDWNDLQDHYKRGSCCIKTDSGWYIDKNIPIFKDEGRKYVDDLVYIGE